LTRDEVLDGFVCIGTNMVIEPIKEDEKTAGGIWRPTTAIPKAVKAHVIKAGTGQKNGLNGDTIPTLVKAGDIVLYYSAGAVDMEVEGVTITTLNEPDVIGFWRAG